MSNGRTLMWVIVAIVVGLLFAAISIPNLLRSRVASNEERIRSLRMAKMVGSEPIADKVALFARAESPSRKLIHNAELGFFVRDVRSAADQIWKLTEAGGGEIDKLEITGNGGSQSATLLVRVPASGLEDALAAFKKVAVRTEREQVSSRDVTREFYDNEAHLRNLQAEEQQYLAVMKQAHTVKDTLEVSQKLSDVRDRIERLQAQIKVMTHDIEMSEVAIVLSQESDTRVFGFQWQPLYHAKVALRDLLSGLGDWLDWVVAVLIKLPLILLWIATVVGILLGGWKAGYWCWLKWFKPKPALE